MYMVMNINIEPIINTIYRFDTGDSSSGSAGIVAFRIAGTPP